MLWKIFAGGKNVLTGVNPIKTQNYRLVVNSGASKTGWDAESNGAVTHGFWNQENKKSHVNYLSLLASFFALKCFAANASRREV